MGWIITKDHLVGSPMDTDRKGYGEGDRARCVPSTEFRLYDGDGNLYYEGLISTHWLNSDESKAFAPLDFGRADAGCVEMRYKNPVTGEWEVL